MIIYVSIYWVPPFGDLRIKVIANSPELIAGDHVLHRQLIPRYPPFALSNLTIKIYSILKHLLLLNNRIVDLFLSKY